MQYPSFGFSDSFASLAPSDPLSLLLGFGCAHLSPSRPANSRPFAPPYPPTPRFPNPLLHDSDRELQPISSPSRVSESPTPDSALRIPPFRAFNLSRLSRRWTSGRRVFGRPMISVLVALPLLFSASQLRISRFCCTRSLRPGSIFACVLLPSSRISSFYKHCCFLCQVSFCSCSFIREQNHSGS